MGDRADLIYHESQQAALCGVHAVNTLLQAPHFRCGFGCPAARLAAAPLCLNQPLHLSPQRGGDGPDRAGAGRGGACTDGCRGSRVSRLPAVSCRGGAGVPGAPCMRAPLPSAARLPPIPPTGMWRRAAAMWPKMECSVSRWVGDRMVAGAGSRGMLCSAARRRRTCPPRCPPAPMFCLPVPQVLSRALEVFGLQAVPLNSPDAAAARADPTTQEAFICNLQVGGLPGVCCLEAVSVACMQRSRTQAAPGPATALRPAPPARRRSTGSPSAASTAHGGTSTRCTPPPLPCLPSTCLRTWHSFKRKGTRWVRGGGARGRGAGDGSWGGERRPNARASGEAAGSQEPMACPFQLPTCLQIFAVVGALPPSHPPDSDAERFVPGLSGRWYTARGGARGHTGGPGSCGQRAGGWVVGQACALPHAHRLACSGQPAAAAAECFGIHGAEPCTLPPHLPASVPQENEKLKEQGFAKALAAQVAEKASGGAGSWVTLGRPAKRALDAEAAEVGAA